MKIKVECPCGTRFEFEVEPVNERMPMPVACPECGADATAAANVVIRAQLRGNPAPPPTATTAPVAPTVHYPSAQPSMPPAVPAAAVVRIAAHPAAPPVTAAAAASVRIAAAPATPVTEAAAVDHSHSCPRHVTEAVVETCRVCSKPICLKCMEQFGYLCSVYCRNQALHKRIYVPPYKGQRTEVARKSNNKAAVIGWAVAALVVAVFATWYWYVYHGRKPTVVYTLAAPKPGAAGAGAVADYYQLIAPGQLLTIANRRVSITDLEKKTERWSVSLAATSSPAQSASMADTADDPPDLPAGFGFGFSSGKRVVVTSNDIWLTGGNSLARLDLQTGSQKPVEVKGRIDHVAAADDMILVISDRNQDHGLLTRISLPDGAAQTEEFGAATPTNSRAKPAAVVRTNQPAARAPVVATSPTRGGRGTGRPTGLPAALQTLANPPGTASDDADMKEFMAAMSTLESRNDPFVPAGQNVAEMQAKVLEARTTTVQTMRKAPGTSVLDDKNLNASQSIDLAQEMMNDSQRQRTGGVATEDVSRYQVTLHRYFDKEATNWTGEIVGPPQFVPLKTIDLVMARTNLYVFDKKNKKLWEAKLEFQVPNRYQYEEQGYPALETKDALFFADRGMLTCFELGSGNARWRITTVGVSAVQVDDKGRVYVDTTPAPPETVKYPDQVNLRRPDKRIVMQVDPASGKILWQTEMPGVDFHCILDGKYLFTTRDWQTQDAFKLAEGPDLNFLFRFVSPGSGETIWSWPELNKHLLRVDAQQHWILLHFAEKVVVLKFFSL